MPHGIIFLKSENCGLADGYVLNENHSDIQNGQLFHLPTINRERLPHNAAGILIKDSETRFWLTKIVSGHKGNDDVTPMFAKAKAVAGKVPEKIISDVATNFGHAHKKQDAAKNSFHKDSEHVRHIHMAGDTNNNQMESFNGNTVRHRENVVRGLKREDSAILTGLRLYHNHVWPHPELPDNTAPGEATGIHIGGDNKWKTIIQNAVRQRDVEGRRIDDGGQAGTRC